MIQPSASIQPDVDPASLQGEGGAVDRSDVFVVEIPYPWLGWVIIGSIAFWVGLAVWVFA